MKIALFLIIGASIGVLIRYFLQKISLNTFQSPVYGTLAANLIGAFAIGFLYPLLKNFSPEIKFLIVTGLLGSLTTMSSFIFESYNLLQNKKFYIASTYFTGTLALSFLLCYMGVFLGSKFKPL